MNKSNNYIAIAFIGFIFINCFFTVEQPQQALVFQFGEAVKVVKEPGLHFKAPFIQKVIYFEKRLLNVTADEKEVTAKDQKRLIVNAFAKYRIVDPLKFYKTVRDDLGIKSRVNSLLDSSLIQIIGEVPLSALLTSQRAEIMKKITQLVNSQASGFGIEVVDVRILRTDLPKENSEAIYKRMQSERSKEAKEFRAEGAEEAQRIKSKADKDRKILLAEAKKQAEITRGEGDATSSKIFAEAYNQDPEFYSFYRSLQAYKKSLSSEDTTMLMSPKNEFLQFMNDATNR